MNFFKAPHTISEEKGICGEHRRSHEGSVILLACMLNRRWIYENVPNKFHISLQGGEKKVSRMAVRLENKQKFRVS